EDARFLDLCAGTGAVGIEALSRGAAHVTFVDQSRKMCALIEANLEALKVNEDEIAIDVGEASEYLRRRLKKQIEPFDIIYFDPPYAANYEDVLENVGRNCERLMANEGLLIVEHHRKNDLAVKIGELERYRVLKQGDSCLSFYRVE